MYIYIYIKLYVCVYTYVYIYILLEYIYIYIYIYIYVSLSLYMYLYLSLSIYIYIYIYIYAHTAPHGNCSQPRSQALPAAGLLAAPGPEVGAKDRPMGKRRMPRRWACQTDGQQPTKGESMQECMFLFSQTSHILISSKIWIHILISSKIWI